MIPEDDAPQNPEHSMIYGLATLAGHAGTRRDIRIKAIRALARIPDQNAVRVLGEMALWEPDEELRAEVMRSLEATFGDDLPDVLEGIRQELTGEWAPNQAESEQEANEEEIDPGFEIEPQATPSLVPANPQTQPVEGAPLWLLWGIFAVLILGGAVYLLLSG